MTTPMPLPTRPMASSGPRAPWYVWVLVGVAMVATGPVVGGGYNHPILLSGGFVLFLAGAGTLFSLYRLRIGAWFCLAFAILACGLAVWDVAVTGTVLVTPIVSLVVTAVLALAAALASYARLSRL